MKTSGEALFCISQYFFSFFFFLEGWIELNEMERMGFTDRRRKRGLQILSSSPPKSKFFFLEHSTGRKFDRSRDFTEGGGLGMENVFALAPCGFYKNPSAP